ncbi:rhotekin-like isoform X1 [Thrips palmi]|uniref:Rhotekin-like isoform X1 n=1 Tax=Thrips palmi TaxID=161013 RepID=A0A6P8YC66_THRPL|nr:rhotekin-like isoform X1 [Thrips palmi]XP_034233901.1 rhotekin-like isoform X1 [Thrips palmi]
MDSCFPPLAALSLGPSKGCGKACKAPPKGAPFGAPPAAVPTSPPGLSATTDHAEAIGKMNILQDLDLYYIRQIAHNLKELDLEQKIDVEIRMREGTTRLLAACRHQTQTLEAAKSLHTSNERMSAYMAELQRRRRAPARTLSQSTPSTARVSVSDLRMPLMWRDTDHFKNKGDHRRFAVFVLTRIGTQILDSTLLCPVDRSLTDLTYPDVHVFNNVPTDFELRLEIWGHVMQDDMSIASTPHKIKRSIHSSISRTVGKKLAASLRDELNTGRIGPNFELMASAHLSLDDVGDSVHTHDLQLENVEPRSHQLPLFGHFCCRLAAQPDCVSREAYSGNALLLESSGVWTQMHGALQAFRLDLWRSLNDKEAAKKPAKTVTVDRDTLIQPGKSGSREILISNVIEGCDNVVILKAGSAEEQHKWIRNLTQHSKDHLRWKQAALEKMEIQSPGSNRNFVRQLRQGSLYDETPLIESVQTEFANHRPTVQDIFGLTPASSLSSCASSSSSPTFRERSHSNSKPRPNSGTIRSHWPFSRNNHD